MGHPSKPHQGLICFSVVTLPRRGLRISSSNGFCSPGNEHVQEIDCFGLHLFDARAKERILDRQDGPTVLVGHSFGGMIVTQAGMHQNVSALVYVAARAPDANEDFAALAKTYPTPPASAGIVYGGEEGRLTEEAFLRDFAGDVPEARAKLLYATQYPFQKTLLAGAVTDAAWHSKPVYYAVSAEDRTINPELQRYLAKRMEAKTIELPASHLSIISHPREVSELILEAAGHG